MTSTIEAIVFLLKTSKNTISLFTLAICLVGVFASTSFAGDHFTDPQKDHLIIMSVINQFHKECLHIYTVDKGSLNKIQEKFTENKDKYTKEQSGCLDTYLSQLRGVFVVYQQTCDEVNGMTSFDNDLDLSRLFVNIRRYLTSFKMTHKLLNSCLSRAGVDEDDLIALSDYEVGTKQVFKKLRAMDAPPPFREGVVHSR